MLCCGGGAREGFSGLCGRAIRVRTCCDAQGTDRNCGLTLCVTPNHLHGLAGEPHEQSQARIHTLDHTRLCHIRYKRVYTLSCL